MDFFLNAVWSLTPTILIGGLFFLLMRSLFTADRAERNTYAKIEREERARLGLPQKGEAEGR